VYNAPTAPRKNPLADFLNLKTALIAGAVALMLIYGPAILLDLAAGVAAFVCL